MRHNNIHKGSNFNDFLKEEGIYEEVTLAAMKRVLIRQIEREMIKQKLTKTALSKKNEYKQEFFGQTLRPKEAFQYRLCNQGCNCTW